MKKFAFVCFSMVMASSVFAMETRDQSQWRRELEMATRAATSSNVQKLRTLVQQRYPESMDAELLKKQVLQEFWAERARIRAEKEKEEAWACAEVVYLELSMDFAVETNQAEANLLKALAGLNVSESEAY